jgi:oligopeptide transport system substrate-binding protein
MNFRISITIIFILVNLTSVNAKNILNRGNGSEVDSLNIHQAQGLNSLNVLRDMFEGLMTLDSQGLPIYGVAFSHEVKNNTWTFKLRKDNYWSNGEKVIATDFIKAWQKAVSPNTASPYSFLFNNFKNYEEIVNGNIASDKLGVNAIDDNTIQIQLTQPDSTLLEKLTLPVFYPQYSETYDPKAILSNGAYTIEDWVIQEKIILKKNKYYANKDIYFDQIIYWVTENQSSELKRFRAGELDITESIPDGQINWIKQNLSSELHIYPYLGTFFLGLNLEDSLLKDINLRKALYYAIDRNILTEKVLKTGQQPAYSLIPSQLTRKVESLESVEFKQLANKYFKLSGLNANEIKIEILYNNSENQRKVAIAVAAMWRQTLGIKAKLVNQEWKVFVQTRKSKQKQVFRSGWIADYADALSFLELFQSKSRFNFYAYDNLRYDELIINIFKQQDKQKRVRLILQAEDLITQTLPIIPLYYYVSRHMVNDKIKGYKDNVSDRHLSKYLFK